MSARADVLIPMLRQLGKITSAVIPNLNYGGCGVYAAAVAQSLKNLGVENVSAIAIKGFLDVPTDAYSVDDVRTNLSKPWTTVVDWYRAGFLMEHIKVKFELDGRTWVHDSAGTHPIEEDTETQLNLFPGDLTIEELTKFAHSPHGWNDSFDRRHIGRIELFTAYLESAILEPVAEAA